MHEEIEEKRRKSSMERSKKISFAELQEKYEQKNRYPGPGAYYRLRRLKVPGVYTNSDPKSSFLLDVEYHAQNSPSSLQYNINLSQVTPRARTATMIKPSKSRDRVQFHIS